MNMGFFVYLNIDLLLCTYKAYMVIFSTLNSAYNEKKYAEILLRYRLLFVKVDVFIGEWGIFGAEVFLRYSRFFIKDDFIIGRVECTSQLYMYNCLS